MAASRRDERRGARLPRSAWAAGAALAWALGGGGAGAAAEGSGNAASGLADGNLLWLVVLAAPLLVAALYHRWRRGAAEPASAPAAASAAETAAPAPPVAASDDRGGDLGDSLTPTFAFYEETFRTLVASLELSRSEQERSYIEVIGAMVATAHARDHETIGHSFRVARYATALARRMGLEGAMLTAIEWGALLHDVGKIGVPERILLKTGPLTDEERRLMELHPRRGYQMLKGLLFLGTALDVVLSHHERWDGRGYPNGLAAEEIPLSARIFAVVDSYDAMTSDRPYRPARSHQEAAEELRRVAGTQLDPRVVERFLDISQQEIHRLRDLSQPVDSSLERLTAAARGGTTNGHPGDDDGGHDDPLPELRVGEG